MAGVATKGVPEYQARLDRHIKGATGLKPVFVGTRLFYGRFQETGTKRGVRATRFLGRTAEALRGDAKSAVIAKLAEGDVMAALIELARRARTMAASKAPSARGKLRRSIKIQVGGSLRRRR